MYPTHIEGTWQFSGPWLGSYRLVATGQDIIPTVSENCDHICPECEYPEAVRLSRIRDNFPLMYYCPECGSIWSWYVARCPDCDGLIENKGCQEGTVKCFTCGMEWDIESAKEINEDPEFHNT